MVGGRSRSTVIVPVGHKAHSPLAHRRQWMAEQQADWCMPDRCTQCSQGHRTAPVHRFGRCRHRSSKGTPGTGAGCRAPFAQHRLGTLEFHKAPALLGRRCFHQVCMYSTSGLHRKPCQKCMLLHSLRQRSAANKCTLVVWYPYLRASPGSHSGPSVHGASPRDPQVIAVGCCAMQMPSGRTLNSPFPQCGSSLHNACPSPPQLSPSGYCDAANAQCYIIQ